MSMQFARIENYLKVKTIYMQTESITLLKTKSMICIYKKLTNKLWTYSMPNADSWTTSKANQRLDYFIINFVQKLRTF